MEKLFNNEDNPLKDFLEHTLETQDNIHISSGISTQPGIPYKQKNISIPRNLVEGTEYCLGGYKVTQSSLSNNIIATLQTLNTIHEELSFLILRQLPVLCNKQSQSIEEHKLVKLELEKHFNKIVKQLEQSRENIRTDMIEADIFSKNEYETLNNQQERIIEILTEKFENYKQISELRQEINIIKYQNETTNKNIQQIFEEITKQIKELNTKI